MYKSLRLTRSSQRNFQRKKRVGDLFEIIATTDIIKRHTIPLYPFVVAVVDMSAENETYLPIL